MKQCGVQSSKLKKMLAFALTVCIAPFAFAPDAFAMLTAKANHDHISVDFFYHGSAVSVKGESEPGVDLVVKITAPEGRQKMRKKGKVAGFLWMNVGDIVFDHTPNLYFLHSTRSVDDILTPAEQDAHLIGYRSLEKHVAVEPVFSPEEKERWFDEFVKFRESSKLYASSRGKIETTLTDKGRQKYALYLDWPYQAPPGGYTVTVYAVKNGKVVETAYSHVKVEQTGVVKALAGMAVAHGGLYGLVSVLVALGAGFGVGMVFGKGGGAH